MQKLSTGDDATLGNYRRLVAAAFGEESPAVVYLDQKIAESPAGEGEEVLADESQVILLLRVLHYNELTRRAIELALGNERNEGE